HLESSELMSVLESRVYWPSMAENIQMYAHECSNCQIVKEVKKELEYEKMIEKIMTKFLHNEIYINYEILYEILTDNSVNLIEEVVRHFMSQLQTRYCRTISYHLQINRKMKHLNEILSNMLMKYL
ncbi:hypothetical protein BDBG_16624, partial [Blastomyces gilchristii SLH14081]